MSRDVSGTTITGGTLLAAIPISKVDGRAIDLEPMGIELAPGEVVTASAASAANTDISININCAELF